MKLNIWTKAIWEYIPKAVEWFDYLWSGKIMELENDINLDDLEYR